MVDFTVLPYARLTTVEKGEDLSTCVLRDYQWTK